MAREHFVEAALADPQRQARVEAIRRASVGVLIRRDVEAARARRLEPLQDLPHLAEVRLVRRFQMPDFRGDVRLLGDREHLVERGENTRTFRSLMREIDAPLTGRDLGQLDDLGG